LIRKTDLNLHKYETRNRQMGKGDPDYIDELDLEMLQRKHKLDS